MRNMENFLKQLADAVKDHARTYIAYLYVKVNSWSLGDAPVDIAFKKKDVIDLIEFLVEEVSKFGEKIQIPDRQTLRLSNDNSPLFLNFLEEATEMKWTHFSEGGYWAFEDDASFKVFLEEHMKIRAEWERCIFSSDTANYIEREIPEYRE